MLFPRPQPRRLPPADPRARRRRRPAPADPVGRRRDRRRPAAAAGYPSTFRGPGVPLLGEHAHELLHPSAPDAGTARRARVRRRLVDPLHRRGHRRVRLPAGRPRRRPGRGTRPHHRVRGPAAAACCARPHAAQHRRRSSYHLPRWTSCCPAADDLAELLDFTGRHEGERTPQRHVVTDGLWMREGREGRPGLGGATLAVLGTAGFTTRTGTVLGVHVAWSGNSGLRVERSPDLGTTLGGGELLQPGEVVLAAGSRTTPPRGSCFGASEEGLDGLARPSTPTSGRCPRTPTTSRWCSTCGRPSWFDHDLPRLREIADRAARVGIERFVLDDGWFHGRRDDTAGLGDWWIDPDVWPDGLTPLAEHVRSLGMQFGLWFEPEMVNPDSDLHRAHPDWILATGDRVPQLHRTSSSSTCRGRRCGSTSTTTCTRCCLAPRSTTSSGTTTASCSRRGPARAAGRPSCGSRPSPSTGCSTRCARPTPRSTGSRAPPAAGGSTSACWSARSGCGPRT